MTVDTTFNQMKGVNGVNKVSNQQTTTKPEEKKPLSKAVVGASLVGLAALASVGIYLATKGKGKVKPQTLVDEVKNQANNTQLEELQKQANELKEKIGREYWNKLGQDKEFISGRSPLDKDAYKELSKDKKDMQKLLDENEPIVKEFSTKVRNSVKALQNDPDYVELRKLRNQYKKECRNHNWQNAGKLQFINELIFTKLNGGQKTPYFKKLGFEQKEAFDMLSLPSEQFVKMMYKNVPQTEHCALEGYEKAAKQNGLLYLDKLFIGGKEAECALNQVKCARNYLDSKVAEKTAQRIRDVRVNVAQEIRQSDDVKALKELNQKIAELSKQTSK